MSQNFVWSFIITGRQRAIDADGGESQMHVKENTQSKLSLQRLAFILQKAINLTVLCLNVLLQSLETILLEIRSKNTLKYTFVMVKRSFMLISKEFFFLLSLAQNRIPMYLKKKSSEFFKFKTGPIKAVTLFLVLMHLVQRQHRKIIGFY